MQPNGKLSGSKSYTSCSTTTPKQCFEDCYDNETDALSCVCVVDCTYFVCACVLHIVNNLNWQILI